MKKTLLKVIPAALLLVLLVAVFLTACGKEQIERGTYMNITAEAAKQIMDTD